MSQYEATLKDVRESTWRQVSMLASDARVEFINTFNADESLSAKLQHLDPHEVRREIVNAFDEAIEMLVERRVNG